ncbi:MAG TPA: protein kinase [Kineosporiaceae bacterium]|nr:protein kinase [Kineosporiaceae bacterium]
MTDLSTDRTDLLSGRYALGEVIGRGGMGVVHRAWDLHLQRYVAVKILRGRATDPVGRARFRAEGQTLARLSHPGLITLLDAQTDGDEPYLVMELVDGESLTKFCEGHGMAVGEVVAIGAAVADALDHVHRRRIIHRDITPSNVLIGRDGRVKLADFGVARLLDGISQLTGTGMTLGTAGYLSPEQVRLEPPTVASDIYSFGLVLIEALSGEPAFVGSWDVIALARLTISPRIDQSLPAPMRELLESMTDPDSTRRPTAAEVAIALRSMSGDSTPSLVAAARRLDEEAGLGHSSDIPTASGEVGRLAAADPPTDPSAKPAMTPHDVSPRHRFRELRGGLIAAVILVPALLLVPATQVDWPGGSTPDDAATAGPGETGTAAPGSSAAKPGRQAASSGTGRATEALRPALPGPEPTTAPSKASGVGVTTPIANPTVAPTATATATATTEAPTPAEARAAAKAAKAKAKAEAKAAKEAAKKAKKGDDDDS